MEERGTIRLLELVRKKPTLEGFVAYCLVPFLYAISLKIKYDIEYVFGELTYGNEGIINDYSSIFGVKNKDEVQNILEMLCLKKRIANKKPCPCKCGNRLGKCLLRLKINAYRNLAPRSWYAKNALL